MHLLPPDAGLSPLLHRRLRNLVCVLQILWVTACASIATEPAKTYTDSRIDTGHTYFGKLAAGWQQLHGSSSGFFPLSQGMDALGVRLDMARKAQATIDLQYFLMKDDNAGLVVMHALLDAADRGVRVRFLLDDVFTTTPDQKLLALNQHPNIEIRLFNPVSRHGVDSLNFLLNFERANRRMHNKSFTVDSAISVVGGRNIAEEYFQLKQDAVFADFDMLAFGVITKAIATSFDDYWNHSSAIPIDQLASADEVEPVDDIRSSITGSSDNSYRQIYREALNSTLLQQLISGEQDLFVASARVIADKPEKLDHDIDGDYMLLATALGELLAQAREEVIFISPYYIPGDDGVEVARQMTARGMRLVVLTNSLASNNHTPVHTAYAGYRHDLIAAGVELYEARANAGRDIQGQDGPEKLTLHTKMIVIDRRYLLVGSLNLDPRSIEINAEMAVLVDSPELAGLIAQSLDKDIPAISYRVLVDADHKLSWNATIDGEAVQNLTSH